jgi:hypothetical protein
MRQGKRLIALALMGAFAVPAPSQAVQVDAAADLVTELVVSAQVSHPSSGKKGTFSLVFSEAQGISASKPPIGSQLDDYAVDPHIGEGVPSGGLPKYRACMTLKVAGVVNHVNRCHVYGDSASIESDPLLALVSAGATLGPTTEFKTTFTLDLQARDSQPTQESVARDTEVRPTTKAGGGFLLKIGEGFRRSGVIVGGAIYDETPGATAMFFVPNSENVTMRQFVIAAGAFDRQPLACGGGNNQGIVIGAAGRNVDVFEQPGTQTPLGNIKPTGDGKEDRIGVPPGCHPDDEIPDVLP